MAPDAASRLLSFTHAIVDEDNPPDPHCKAAGDLDGDGHPDLLAASASGGGLFWYRYPHWTKHPIAAGSFTTDMAAVDVDGDGHLDVVIPSGEGLMWYRNPRGLGQDPAGDPWPATNISAEGARMHDVRAVDLDGNGRLDLVTRHQSGFGKRMGDQIHVWLQESSAVWHHRTFPCPHGEGLAVADVDGDGRPDVIIGGRWYRNPGDPLAGEWSEHLYIPEARFASGWTNGDVAIAAGDLDGDGHLEIVLSPAEGRGLLAWYHRPAQPSSPDWVEHVLDPGLDHAHGLAVGDMDNDGHLDLVVAKMHQASAPQEVCVYRNQGHARAWTREVVAVSGSHNIQLVDVDRNGWLDIYGANWSSAAATGGRIEIWLNQGR
ncbi:MAG: VCBS repeat-containing protein [Candidatus Latescibacterota bacterium]